MKKKVLYCASNDIHIKNFHIPYLKFFKDNGFEVHLASHGGMSFPYVDMKWDIAFEKNILSAKNLLAINTVKNILEQNHFEIISIHTTLAGAIVRAAIILAGKRNTRVIYTSHGYFFWNGGPFANWIKYLPPEKICAGVTDCVIAMNYEDFALAQKYKLCSGDVELIPGMGVDLERYKPYDNVKKRRMRQCYGIHENDFLVIYPAEMSRRKNHRELLKAFAIFLNHVPSGRLLLPGDGLLLKENLALAEELEILERVMFPGHIDGMEEVYPMCDMAVSSSISEGLPLNIIEAMACGLPIVASRIRGHIELIDDKRNNCLYLPGDAEGLARAMYDIFRSKDTLKTISIKNIEKAEQYSLEKAKERICAIYYKNM
ncbi:glycosyltransferase [Desulfosporosinus sp. Sb-LF]|uniref:glycosyltransferase n=1 Tax=Desulfosporosinus sp. Sb-LF TaxID=2560027 RepID=UPI00107F74D8|nr:glycosyltransferase [Desulfosporosinus sp. Sb-LF]TGE33799.1 glycosyltransferase [Desulfosporosinus sp. Sb-LF]